MEGLTGYVFRKNYEKHFGRGKIDKYFIPFISPNKTDGYTAREREDIAPNNNVGVTAIPQIMANNSDYFIRAACMLTDMGYKEVNLNLGCPSGTVVSKFKGAGFLAKPDDLDRFLYEVMSSPKMEGIDVSIKTRIGMESPEEFHYLLTIYNQFKFKEIIVHPRVRSDYYKNVPNLEAFEEALEYSENPVCYNGDIFTAADFKGILERFPKEKYSNMTAVMIGRGFIGNPLIIDDAAAKNDGKQRIREFCEDLFADYLEVFSGDVNALHKMKEVWFYLAGTFVGGEKALKQIKKAKRACDYRAAVDEFFYTARLKEE